MQKILQTIINKMSNKKSTGTAKNTIEITAPYQPFRLTKIGHLRPYDGQTFDSPEKAAAHANSIGSGGEGEKITVLYVVGYAPTEATQEE